MTRRKLPSASTAVRNWHKLYTAALFETDKQKLLARMAKAEGALVKRARELFAMSDSEEAQAIDDALYALHALRNCLELETSRPMAA